MLLVNESTNHWPQELCAHKAHLPPHALGYGPEASVVLGEGDEKTLKSIALREHWGRSALLVTNAPLLRQKLFGPHSFREAGHFDLLELFAFVRPAQFCAPSVAGLCLVLGFPEPVTLQEKAQAQWRILAKLCAELKASDLGFRLFALSGLKLLDKNRWPWAALLTAILTETDIPADYVVPSALEVGSLLDEWEDYPQDLTPRQVSITGPEVEAALGQNLARGGLDEKRPEQVQFALKARDIFDPKWALDQPNMVLLEAGTGVGKTLGYLTPALLWAEKAQSQVWISTYTKALQKQIFNDTRLLFDTPQERDEKVVVRKGRENYLCLLNFHERLPSLQSAGEMVIATLLARWIVYSRDGDIISGDFPTWLPLLLPVNSPASVFGSLSPASLVDRRGECTYGACAFYRQCFIEKSQRKSKAARLVIANHALVMAQSTLELRDRWRKEKPSDDTETPEAATALSRLIFDEGHHVFEAADGAFSICLSGLEAYELRRWLRGNEGRSRRGRGLEARLKGLIDDDEAAKDALKTLMRAAMALPSDSFSQRLTTFSQEGLRLEPSGPIEALLQAVLEQIDIRQTPSKYRSEVEQAKECEALPPIVSVGLAATEAARALAAIEAPMLALVRALEARLGDGSNDIDMPDRTRLEGVLQGLERRARMLLPGWRQLLQQLSPQMDTDEAPESIIWFGTELHRGRLADVSLNRHYVDPSVPLADYVLKPAHGVLMASATLSDKSVAEEQAFALAKARTGADHLVMNAKTERIASPFDYSKQARLYVVTDVPRDDVRAVASAMQSLFVAAKGGALGLFTAIARLRRVHAQIETPLSKEGISLYAQHVDPLDVSDLISMFRAETHSCLLGTDAVRDGIDVPGEALRLIVFDKMPWPRPDCLHRNRRTHFGQKSYDDALTKGKLAQAFGRLIRKSDDKGAFVMLDAAAPSRLLQALPEGVVIQRCTLKEALDALSLFLFNSEKI